MDSPDPPAARPDREVLADVLRRGAQRAVDQRRRRRVFGAAAVVAVIGLVAAIAVAQGDDSTTERVMSADASTTTQVSDSTSTTSEAAVDPGFDLRETVDASDLDKPPAIRIGNADHQLDLRAWTTCWSGGGAGYCADGAAPEDLERIDGADALYVEFPIEGWEFEARSELGGGRDGCGRSYSQPLEKVGPTLFRLPPMGPPGDYSVDVFGRGDGGDVIVTFAWTTDVTGAFAQPTSSLSLLADNDGVVDSYGVEFGVANLDRTPTTVAAKVTVTASNGRSHTIELRPRGEPCGEGTIDLTAPTEEGLKAARLGDRPFTYDVTLTLDGTNYEARATWPDGVDEECAPCVPLEFDPPLPGLGD